MAVQQIAHPSLDERGAADVQGDPAAHPDGGLIAPVTWQ